MWGDIEIRGSPPPHCGVTWRSLSGGGIYSGAMAQGAPESESMMHQISWTYLVLIRCHSVNIQRREKPFTSSETELGYAERHRAGALLVALKLASADHLPNLLQSSLDPRPSGTLIQSLLLDRCIGAGLDLRMSPFKCERQIEVLVRSSG